MFRYRLAGHLGKTVAELERAADPWEISHWMALQNIDGPIGEWRNDYRFALVASWMATSAGSAVEPAKLIPQWDATAREKYEAAQEESVRLQRAQRQLTGGS